MDSVNCGEFLLLRRKSDMVIKGFSAYLGVLIANFACNGESRGPANSFFDRSGQSTTAEALYMEIDYHRAYFWRWCESEGRAEYYAIESSAGVTALDEWLHSHRMQLLEAQRAVSQSFSRIERLHLEVRNKEFLEMPINRVRNSDSDSGKLLRDKGPPVIVFSDEDIQSLLVIFRTHGKRLSRGQWPSELRYRF